MTQGLIRNWEQTTVSYVPISNCKEGSKKVPIAGIGDKRQITFMLVANMTGKLLPL